MTPMRRRTSSAVIEGTPRVAGRCRCAAASPGSMARNRPRRCRMKWLLETGMEEDRLLGGLHDALVALGIPLRPLRRVGDVETEVEHQLDDAGLFLRVDLVGRIAHLVIIGVGAV